MSPSNEIVEQARRIEQTWARDAVEFAHQLRRNDPAWGTETFPLAGGHAVLSGPGLYVNGVLAGGLDVDFTPADLDILEEAGRRVGVRPMVEVTPATDGCVLERCRERGHEPVLSVNVVVMSLPLAAVERVDPLVRIETIDLARVAVWQEISAHGWGHHTAARRRASDAFAAAAFETPGETLVVARAADGRALGCATLTITSGIATLGGMSTLPTERGRGGQRALVAYRLDLAQRAGCDLAVTSVVPSGTSERNLLRRGFRHLYRKHQYHQRP